MDHAPAHRLNEFPVSYSLTGCAPALPVSASPTALEYAVQSSCRPTVFQRTSNSVLTICVSRGQAHIELVTSRIAPVLPITFLVWRKSAGPEM